MHRRGRMGRTLAALVALVALAALVLVTTTPAALATQAHAKRFRVHRVCRAPHSGTARCLALKLIPAALTGAELKRSAARQGSEAATGRRPAVTDSNPEQGNLTPQRLHAAYALPGETAAAPLQTVAVVDAFDDPTAEADLDVYDKQFGLAPCTSANGCFRKVNQSGNAGPLPRKQGEWAGEISIDVQMARAICPGCRILLVEAGSEGFGDLGAAVNAAAKAGATEISNSYGGAEEQGDANLGAHYFDHPGIVLTASSGDCGYFNKTCPGEPTGANFPADSSDVLAVGGTSLQESNGAWSSTVWSEGGSGCSNVFSAAPWQGAAAGFAATGCGSGRSVADVAAIGDPETGVDVYDSTPEGNGNPTGWGVWGGTSVAAPIVAAEFGLAGGAHGVEYPGATLYPYLGSGALYDVVSGGNGSCSGTTACDAAAGYDGPTGVGSPHGLEALSVAGVPANATPPAVAGPAEQGQTLKAMPGEWSSSPSSLHEQWARCNVAGYGCSPITGATASSYKLTAADAGSSIRVQESAANAAGEGPAAASAATAPVGSSVPAITGFTPSSGITGSSLRIEGAALAGVSEVKLGKLAASFTVISSSELEAIVPDGAKAGRIAIFAPGGSVVTKARYTPSFSLASFSPKHGAAGKLVKLKGVGFTPGSTVSFGGVAAGSVTFVSATTLDATVPPGAASAQITVTNASAPAGTIGSAAAFVVP